MLSGKKYVGGIAGLARDIISCRCWAFIESAAEYAGAVAGWSDGEVSGNLYVDSSPAGIDNVSFSGMTDPLTSDELERLRAFEYPENLDGLRRALKAIAERDVFPKTAAELETLVSSEVGTRTDLSTSTAAARTAPDEETDDDSNEFLTLDEAMKAHIERALARSHGVVDGKNGAAKALAINPYTLRARMVKLGIDWTAFRDDDESDG